MTVIGQMASLGNVFAEAQSTGIHRTSVKSPSESATTDRILHKEVHNAKEALNLLYEAAAESRSDTDDGNTTHAASDSHFRDKDDLNTVAWRDFWCVKAGWMTEGEARHYVDLYFPTRPGLTNAAVSLTV
jgi:hypothetical protein